MRPCLCSLHHFTSKALSSLDPFEVLHHRTASASRTSPGYTPGAGERIPLFFHLPLFIIHLAPRYHAMLTQNQLRMNISSTSDKRVCMRE